MIDLDIEQKTLTDEFEFVGIWHMPDFPELELHGTLKYTPSETILKLTGAFDNPSLKAHHFRFGVKRQYEKLDIILGTIFNNKQVTLENCFFQHRTSGGGFEITEYRIGKIFIGTHFEKPQDIKFKELAIHYSYLDEWIGHSGFDTKSSNKKFIITHTKQKKFEKKIIQNYSVSIFHASMFPSVTRWDNEFTLWQHAFFVIKNTTVLHLKEFEKVHRIIQNFLTLAVTKPVYPLMIRGLKDGPNIYFNLVYIFYNYYDIPKNVSRMHQIHMLFNFDDVSNRLGYYLKQWILKQDELEDIFDLHFGTLYNPRVFLSHKFQSLVQAMETYHRIRSKKKNDIPLSQYNKMIQQIKKNIKNKHYRDWFKAKSKLKIINELSLPYRLSNLVDKFPYVLENPQNERQNFVESIVHTRNYYAHRTSELKQKAVKDNDLFFLTLKMRVLVEAILLHELGFSKSRLKDLVTKSRKDKQEYQILG